MSVCNLCMKRILETTKPLVFYTLCILLWPQSVNLSEGWCKARMTISDPQGTGACRESSENDIPLPFRSPDSAVSRQGQGRTACGFQCASLSILWPLTSPRIVFLGRWVLVSFYVSAPTLTEEPLNPSLHHSIEKQNARKLLFFSRHCIFKVVVGLNIISFLLLLACYLTLFINSE